MRRSLTSLALLLALLIGAFVAVAAQPATPPASPSASPTASPPASPTASPAASPVASPVAAATPSADLGAVDCDAVTAWSEGLVENIATLSGLTDVLTTVFTGGDVDAATVREAADAVRDTAEAQAAAAVPAVAVPINDAYVEALGQAATALDAVAEAAAAGDPAAVLTAATDLTEVFNSLESAELTALADDLNTACPGLSDL